MSKKNYGDYSTSSFKLAADYVLPSTAYAVVYSIVPSIGSRKYYYAKGETILIADYIGETAIVVVYDNDN